MPRPLAPRRVPCPPQCAIDSAIDSCPARPPPRQVPISGVPHFGGKTHEGTIAVSHRWGVDKVPSPSEIVGSLDQFVIGQVRAQEALPSQEAPGGEGFEWCFGLISGSMWGPLAS